MALISGPEIGGRWAVEERRRLTKIGFSYVTVPLKFLLVSLASVPTSASATWSSPLTAIGGRRDIFRRSVLKRFACLAILLARGSMVVVASLGFGLAFLLIPRPATAAPNGLSLGTTVSLAFLG